METITDTAFITCSNCDEKTNRYYLDLKFKGKICYKCLINHHNSFPKGKGVHVPCKLCKPPTIHWIYKKTCGKNQSDCGNHDDE